MRRWPRSIRWRTMRWAAAWSSLTTQLTCRSKASLSTSTKGTCRRLMLRMSSVDFVAHQNDAVLLSNLCLHRGRIVGFIAGQGLVHELAPMFAEHAFDAADHLAVERVIQQVVLPVAEH